MGDLSSSRSTLAGGGQVGVIRGGGLLPDYWDSVTGTGWGGGLGKGGCMQSVVSPLSHFASMGYMSECQ